MTTKMIPQAHWNPIQPKFPYLEFDIEYVWELLILIVRSGLSDDIDADPEDPRKFDPDWLMMTLCQGCHALVHWVRTYRGRP